MPILQAISPVILVKDVALSAAYWHEKLGFEPTLYNGDTFAILRRDGLHLMLCKAPVDATITPNWRVADKCNDVYIWVDDAKTLYDELRANGTTIDYTLYDTPWGTREFGIQDLDDHDVTFGQVLS